MGMVDNDDLDMQQPLNPASSSIQTVAPGASPNQQPNPNHADFKTFVKLLSLWIWTIVLTILLVVTVNIYEAKGVITSAQKDTYNVLTTALILLLGLSFFSSLTV